MLTADDVLDLELPNGVSGYEFVDGEPVPVMSGSPIHARLIVEVIYRLRLHTERIGLSGTVYTDAGFVLDLRRDRERMRGPDVAYVSQEKVEAHPDPERLFRCAPDFVVEIDLTSAKKPGAQQRIVDYLEAGVQLVWAIDPHSRTALAYRPDGSARLYRSHETLDASDVVPGFTLSLPALFGSDATH